MMSVGVAAGALMIAPAQAQQRTVESKTGANVEGAVTDQPGLEDSEDVLVTGRCAYAGTKTDTPLIEVPQPITVITKETFRRQGAINIADTVRYAASVNADAYGRDTRMDGFTIRGIEGALQLRDGMRDIFNYYASIASDPYNFSRL